MKMAAVLIYFEIATGTFRITYNS